MTTTPACIIPLTDAKDFQHIKHSPTKADTQTIEHYIMEVRVPTLDSGASKEEFFFFLSRFCRAMTIMELQDGKCLLQNFERHLYDTFFSN
jgi:hypothetical protein